MTLLSRRRRRPPLLSHTNISIILSEAKLFVAFCPFREDLHNCPREITPRLCDLFQKVAPIGVEPRSARDRTGARRASGAQQKPRKLGILLMRIWLIRRISRIYILA